MTACRALGGSDELGRCPALSAAETRAAEALLARAWGPGTSVRAAEPIWDRLTCCGCMWPRAVRWS
jgi:hypothetical protein